MHCRDIESCETYLPLILVNSQIYYRPVIVVFLAITKHLTVLLF